MMTGEGWDSPAEAERSLERMSDESVEKNRLRFAERLGLIVGPIPIRLVLALTFLWAGIGKFATTIPVAGEDALVLFEMGAISAPGGAAEAAPEEAPAPEPSPEPTIGGDGNRVGLIGGGTVLLVSQDESAASYTAADFAEPVEKWKVYDVALRLRKGASPGFEEGTSKPRRPIVPGWAVQGSWPIYIAFTVAITEIVAGFLVLVGLLTRVSAFGLACVMGGALWLTDIGPAIQDGTARLGFLPGHGAFSDLWEEPLWHVALFAAAVSLVFTGAGTASMHAFLFRGRAGDDDADDED